MGFFAKVSFRFKVVTGRIHIPPNLNRVMTSNVSPQATHDPAARQSHLKIIAKSNIDQLLLGLYLANIFYLPPMIT